MDGKPKHIGMDLFIHRCLVVELYAARYMVHPMAPFSVILSILRNFLDSKSLPRCVKYFFLVLRILLLAKVAIFSYDNYECSKYLGRLSPDQELDDSLNAIAAYWGLLE
jgi:hypothetical protein